MSDNGRISLLFVLNLVFFFLIGEINNSLSMLNVSLHLDVLLILFFGLHINRTMSLVYTLILGLLANASHPVPPGTYVIGYLSLWLFIVWSQRRIRRQNPRHVRIVAIGGQLLLILGPSLYLGGTSLGSMAYWNRILLDLLFSFLAIYLLAWPWCSIQRRFLHSLGWNLEAQLAHR